MPEAYNPAQQAEIRAGLSATGGLVDTRVNERSEFLLALSNRTGGTLASYSPLGQSTDKSARLYAYYRPASGSAIRQSDDGAATWSADRTLPASVTAGNVAAIVEFGGKVYLLGTDGSSFGVWRADVVAQAGDWSWSAKLVSMPAGFSSLANLSLTVSNWGANDALYLSTYGDPSGGAKLYRSTDGDTWNVIWSNASIRHCHHAAPDPYVPGHIVMTVGDGVANPILQSTDYGDTWTAVVASSAWQGVQVSYTPTDIWIATDTARSSVIVIDRATLTPKHGSSNYHHFTAPPMFAGGARTITDLATTAGSATVTSATANFTRNDIGRYMVSNGLLQPGSFINAWTSATQVTLNAQALNSASGSLGTATFISGDMYYASAFVGIVDPATGVWYQIANDSSGAGTMYGVFVLPQKGGRLELLDPGYPLYRAAGGNQAGPLTGAAIIHRDYLYCGGHRYKLLTSAD